MSRAAAPLQWLTMGLLAVGLLGLSPALSLSLLAFGLAVLTALKLREARNLEERRVVALLQLVCAGLLAALRPELGPSLLQGLAILMALAGLLALELGAGPDWKALMRRSLQVLLAALPIALVLFLLLPRLMPFSNLGTGQGMGAMTGLSDSMEPGSISRLAVSRAAAARVAFPLGGGPPPLEQRFWRVLVHERFDGRRWRSAAPPFARPGAGQPTPPPPAAPGEGIQLWLIEPSGLSAVPWSGAGRPLSPDLTLQRSGELLNRAPGSQRRVYALTQTADRGDWRSQPPGPIDLVLPRGENPRLEALAADWRRLGSDRERLNAAGGWFRSQPFRYTLEPGALPRQAPLDHFLFESRLGFCGHYASAFTTLMRAAGVPARVVSGYRGGQWVQPVGGSGYVDLRQADAHAWSEVWLQGEGWQRVDPTAWADGDSLARAAATGERTTGTAPWNWLQQQWWGLDIAWARWWLGYDSEQQQALVQRLLGDQRHLLGLVVLLAVALSLAASLGGLGWLGRRRSGDPLRLELDRTLRALARQGLAPQAGETLPVFAQRLAQQWPALAGPLNAYVAHYQRQRFTSTPSRSGRRETQRLGRALRRSLHTGIPSKEAVQRGDR
ncbi:transglutaminase TgpA family protein [Synechococcus sp. BA-132 BA5]|uniref:transglutaminase TgpA family protein n=1 Tax=Synechococcus sp. BA-132 BA5 TaxID=3110252 RepID=UPI002B1FD969|nr:transglutaminaseTgpA domain-containing protein [Synechococcus sp. BA-132 BA5]MEA5416455.1 transglutaminaseTgpA domain-containing protein [Synechococcus sp. BA-132 BA5]